MMSVLISLLATLRGLARLRAALHVELLAVRHQRLVLQRSPPRRPRLVNADRWLWAWLSRSWTDWRAALVIVKPETVVAWHRQGFRLFWTWKSRRRGGRPTVPADVRALIRTMSRRNALWGAPRIHGELLELGVDVSQAAVAEYMVRRSGPPSRRGAHSWRTTSSTSRLRTSSSCRRQRVGYCSCAGCRTFRADGCSGCRVGAGHAVVSTAGGLLGADHPLVITRSSLGAALTVS